MPTRLEQLNAAAKKAQEKRDAIAQEQKALAQKLNAEKRKQRNKRIFNWGGHLEGLLEDPELLTDDDVHRLLNFLFSSNYVKKLVSTMGALARGDQAGTIAELLENATRQQAAKDTARAHLCVPSVHVRSPRAPAGSWMPVGAAFVASQGQAPAPIASATPGYSARR